MQEYFWVGYGKRKDKFLEKCSLRSPTPKAYGLHNNRKVYSFEISLTLVNRSFFMFQLNFRGLSLPIMAPRRYKGTKWNLCLDFTPKPNSFVKSSVLLFWQPMPKVMSKQQIKTKIKTAFYSKSPSCPLLGGVGVGGVLVVKFPLLCEAKESS